MTKKVESNYKVEGSGSTLEEADRKLEDSLKGLKARIVGANIPDYLAVVSKEYRASFSLSSDTDSTSIVSFEARGNNPKQLKKAASRVAGSNLENYTAVYHSTQYLNLTERQLDVVKRGSSRPTASFDRSSSPLGIIFNRERIRF